MQWYTAQYENPEKKPLGQKTWEKKTSSIECCVLGTED